MDKNSIKDLIEYLNAFKYDRIELVELDKEERDFIVKALSFTELNDAVS